MEKNQNILSPQYRLIFDGNWEQMFLTDFHNVLNTEQSYRYDKRHNAIPTGWIRFFITHKSSLKALQ